MEVDQPEPVNFRKDFIPQCQIPVIEDEGLFATDDETSFRNFLSDVTCFIIPKTTFSKHEEVLNKVLSGKKYLGLISVDDDIFVIERNSMTESEFVQDMFKEPEQDEPMIPHYLYDPHKDKEMTEIFGNDTQNNPLNFCTTQVMECLLKEILLNIKSPLPSVDDWGSHAPFVGKTTALDFVSDEWKNVAKFLFKEELFDPKISATELEITQEDRGKVNINIKILQLTNLMKCSIILKFNCAVMASLIRQKNPDVIRKTFDIPDDLSNEEKQKIKEETMEI